MAIRIAAVCLALAGCVSSPTEPGPTVEEMFTLICIDSVWVHPTYNCWTRTVTVTLIIENPNP